MTALLRHPRFSREFVLTIVELKCPLSVSDELENEYEQSRGSACRQNRQETTSFESLMPFPRGLENTFDEDSLLMDVTSFCVDASGSLE